MKTFISLFLLISIHCIGYCQKTVSEKFIFENKEVHYCMMSFSQTSTNKIYVFLNSKKNLTDNSIKNVRDCHKNKNQLLFYFVTIPEEVDKKKFFLEIMSCILSSRKLIDNQLIIVSDEDYTALYLKVKTENRNKYNYGYLNDIRQKYIDIDYDKICDIIE